MYYETYGSVCEMSQQGADGGRAYRHTHEMVTNGQSLKCHYVKRISCTYVQDLYFIHIVMNAIYSYSPIKCTIGDHIQVGQNDVHT